MSLLKRNYGKKILAFCGALVITASLATSAYAGMANNIYVTPVGQENSDVITADWRTTVSANNTYWSLYCWGGNTINGYTSIGYAGFQQIDSTTKKSIFSMFISNGVLDASVVANSFNVHYKAPTATVDYFNNEGSGIRCINNYSWQQGNWYRLAMRIWNDPSSGNTVYGQWIKDISNNSWKCIAQIEKTDPNEYFGNYIGFQEDFSNSTDGFRNFETKNYYERSKATSQWKDLNTADIYIPTFYNKVGTASVLDGSNGTFSGYASDEPDTVTTYSGVPTRVTLPAWSLSSVYQDNCTISNAAASYTPSTGITKIDWTVPQGSIPMLKYRMDIYMGASAVANGAYIFPAAADGSYSANLERILNPGTYTVKLSIEDIYGKTQEVSKTLIVN